MHNQTDGGGGAYGLVRTAVAGELKRHVRRCTISSIRSRQAHAERRWTSRGPCTSLLTCGGVAGQGLYDDMLTRLQRGGCCTRQRCSLVRWPIGRHWQLKTGRPLDASRVAEAAAGAGAAYDDALRRGGARAPRGR
jgi:hypothetical protein